MLRISPVRVAPMKIPSSIHEAQPISTPAMIHGKKSRAASRTSGAVVIRSIKAPPQIAKTLAITTQTTSPHMLVIMAARLSRARSRAPIARPTKASAAKAKPSIA